ncbi:hypothetical protein [Streptomyces sp. NPDC013171]|uniref:hypothetical protein n=1 Tax=Streptomyces sp. NPDC013171 TaxID=3364863 RepID=UPI0036B1DD53
MGFSWRRENFRRRFILPATVLTCVAAAASVNAFASDEGPVAGDKYILTDAMWTTAHVYQKGALIGTSDTGLVVTYLTPAGRVPSSHGDWIGIYEKGQLDTGHRIDWDWVCPNEHERCLSHGSAVVPAGDDGMRPGATYTVAYWADDAKESSGTPVATIDYVVPW